MASVSSNTKEEYMPYRNEMLQTIHSNVSGASSSGSEELTGVQTIAPIVLCYFFLLTLQWHSYNSLTMAKQGGCIKHE